MPKSSIFIKSFYPEFIWKISSYEDKRIYLTFDDGPTPGVTCEVLKILDWYKVKATFFCVGENVKKYPSLFDEIIKKGHSIGNHTFKHLNGWKVGNIDYLRSIISCSEVMPFTNLFRPPYGKIKKSQARAISNKFRVIMWDVISGDFDTETSKEQCLRNVIDNSESGSIVVFHDSLKAKEKVLFALPKTLDYFGSKEFSFSRIILD